MFPSIRPNSLLLVNRLTYVIKKPKVGDIVVVQRQSDKKRIVKRISRIYDSTYFVLGDNKRQSTDSRHFGVITDKEIVGKVVYIFSKEANY